PREVAGWDEVAVARELGRRRGLHDRVVQDAERAAVLARGRGREAEAEGVRPQREEPLADEGDREMCLVYDDERERRQRERAAAERARHERVHGRNLYR